MFLLTLRKSLGTLLLLVLVVLFSVVNGYGQGKNFSVNKTEPSWIVKIAEKKVKTPLKDVSDGFYLSLYENQNHAERKEEFTHIIREIVSDAGVQNGSQLSVSYAPDYQKLIFHKVILWRNNVPQDQLSAVKFKILQSEKELSRFIYNGTYEAFLLLDDVRKGDRIEFSYTLQGDNPIFGKKFSSTCYFEGATSISHVYTNIIIDKNRQLNVKSFNDATAPKITEKDNLKFYEWESTLTKTHRGVDYEPSWYNPLKRIQVSEYKNWNEVVQWGLAVNDYPDLKTPLLDKKVIELKAKAGNDKKKYIELATRFVQDEIRYMGIEIGAYSHRPNSPEKILKQRYGDCKDKSLLLVHLLKAIDVKAYMAYVDTYLRDKTIDYLPSPFVFNHVIVMVEYDYFKTWIDPTISYQRGSFDNFYSPDYGNALVLKANVSGLEKIESNPAGKLISDLDFNLADTTENRITTLQIKTTYTDHYADNIRAEIAESGTDGTEKNYLEYYTKLYPEIETKAPLKYVDDEKNNTIEITESYQISNAWVDNSDGNDKQFFFYGDLISHQLRKITGSKRIAPLAIANHVNIQQRIAINMPYDTDLGTENFKIENDKYYFELYRFQRDRKATFDYTFRTMAGVIEPDEIKNYIKESKQIDEYLTYHVNRKGSEITANSGIGVFTVVPFIMAIVITGFLVFLAYRKRTEFDIEKIAYAAPIGDWLVLLGIRVVYLPFLMLISPLISGLFSNSFWTQLGAFGSSQWVVKSAFAIEAIIYGFLFSYGIYCAVLFFNKRTNFPKHFIILSISHVGFLIFDIAIALYVDHITQTTSAEAKGIPGLMGTVLMSAVWTWYLLKSQRVKETFVFTYPKEEWEQALAEYYSEQYSAKTTTLKEVERIEDQETMPGAVELEGGDPEKGRE
ncbi:DUF3857 domain-containing protein [Pedobacter foliorum]|uniref:DUF3857 domain-containing protein n=1 Tax=Pedobacter foliorum TaxID=2739058 RepID=UPI001565042E|nr:DUF3857 domain-containing protein [Pedobacter foliorum]NRF37375.1 DUF3857 domain-containing protein [Pedobacter foliorum]